MRGRRLLVIPAAVVVIVAAAIVVTTIVMPRLQPEWSATEIATLKSLWIGGLGPVPNDPSNKVADDPRAALLGQKFFFDTRFSANGQVSCSSCHQPMHAFTDGLPLAKGAETTNRSTMPIVGTQYNTWFFWDGRKDSQWAQALGPLESSAEHAGSRGEYAQLIAKNYKAEYEAVFGSLPPLADAARFPAKAGPVKDTAAHAAWDRMRADDRDAITQVYVNMGKAIEAYERRLMPGTTRFDQYVADVVAGRSSTALTPQEVSGLHLFVSTAHCTNCHNGPLFTNGEFHNTGVPEGSPGADLGRIGGASAVMVDEFNCLSKWSDAAASACAALKFVKAGVEQLRGQFKVPSLRGVADRGPYMHAGQFTSLADVVAFYDTAPAATQGKTELHPIGLTPEQRAQIVAFLGTLSGPPAVAPELLRAP